jgi:aminoglycoside phosphotransferase
LSERPRVDQPHYGDHLGDVEYWGPYVLEVLARHQESARMLEAPFVGSFPTFLAGDLVVKLFGPAFDGPASFRAEHAMHRLLALHADIPAPELVAFGHLFDDEPSWPYLITERWTGVAIREAEVAAGDAIEIAAGLGTAVARLHRLAPPAAVAERELLPHLRSTAAERLARAGFPVRLVDQVPEYLGDALPADTLVHADITADHLFVQEGRLLGVIDWGDAIVADPYYELVAVYFDALGGRRFLLESFLRAYGWVRDDDFCRRALQGLLEFQFDALGRVREMVDLDAVATLDELAERLYG